MKLYNTMTRKKEDFTPINPGHAGLYICGPTVYNQIHVGNARVYVVFDVLRRFLEHCGYNVNLVQNFTDIDDRIIAMANDGGVDFIDISNKYIAEFLTDTDALNVRRATHYPRVTEEIPGIIVLVQHLVATDYAYEVSGTVYFNAPRANNYGKLSKKNIDDLEAGARVEVNSDKHHPSDFVLWKAAKPGEPSWPSPWGTGRPGWHIECSVMSRKYIGQTIDIHAGGQDLIFPHHENEIAQSEAESPGQPFVNYWLHNGMILSDNQKMSKSDGNFFLVREVAQKFSYPVLRFFLLSAHYRMPLNFSEDLMQAAANGLERIRNCRRNLQDALNSDAVIPGHDPESPTQELTTLRQAFTNALSDDLNTANAITALFDLVKFANTHGGNPQAILTEMDFMCDILGLNLDTDSINTNATEIENLLAERNDAKANKDWTKADQIRDQLAEMGIIIKDTREGTKWHYAGK